MTKGVYVRTPCRLHFGMFGFGHADKAQFGGVGAMIEPPSVEVDILPANCFIVHGSLADRTRQVVELLAAQWRLSSLPTCEIVVRSPRDHTGLGVGTQLGLAVAAGLRRVLNLSDTSMEQLSAAAGRGARSAVGTYGFQLGGLIVDGGKEPGQPLGNLATRVALPNSWRFLLFCRPNDYGLAGTSEALAFGRLPAVPDEITRELWAITNNEILPAVEHEDCTAFGDAVYRFGRLAGECFAPVQGGAFASANIGRLVESIREFGVPGVGQSSWGPTVFAITASDEEAQRLIDWVRNRDRGSEYEIVVAKPNNCGATIQS
jgi:beta-ribofuranosylaminobenzene 5'-phosphate synthase